MPVFTGKGDVEEIVSLYAEANAVMPTICYSNNTEVEGALAAAQRYGENFGIKHPAIGLSMV